MRDACHELQQAEADEVAGRVEISRGLRATKRIGQERGGKARWEADLCGDPGVRRSAANQQISREIKDFLRQASAGDGPAKVRGSCGPEVLLKRPPREDLSISAAVGGAAWQRVAARRASVCG
jgi:hypothetical protein